MSVGPASLSVELLALALSAAAEAADFLVDERPADLVASATKSSPTDVVTAMDIAAERLIVAHLRRHRPDDAFLGEEGTASGPAEVSDAGGARVRWVVDPIDGTVNYLRGIPAWAVSIGAEVDGLVVAGAVLNPSAGETFTAVRGGGARRNGVLIAVSGAAELSGALVATGFGYDRAVRAEQAEVVRVLMPEVGDIRRMGAASLDLCAVACGRVDGYYERGLKPWDLAAGGLIAAEAGARVEGLHAAPAGERLVVAAGQALFEGLHDLLVAAGA